MSQSPTIEEIRRTVDEALLSPLRKELLRETLDEALEAWGQRYGIDIEDPKQMRLDLAHLRKWRVVVEKSGMRAALTVVTVFVTSILGVIWLGIQLALNRHI